jgi:hypothetical protein
VLPSAMMVRFPHLVGIPVKGSPLIFMLAVMFASFGGCDSGGNGPPSCPSNNPSSTLKINPLSTKKL